MRMPRLPDRARVTMPIFLILLGLLASQMIVLLFPRAAGNLLPVHRAGILLFETVCVTWGILLYWLGDTPRKRRLLVLGPIAFFVALELALQLVGFLSHLMLDDSADWARRYLLPPYQDKPWARQLFSETDHSPGGHVDFLDYRRREFHGTYVNVDSEGIRKTWEPPGEGTDHTTNIYCFGGSTVWGVGARDDFTIPSLLSNELYKHGFRDFRVYNYGESGWVFSQGVVQLLLLLKKGRKVDVALFYDGVNDVQAAWRSGRSGTTMVGQILRARLDQGFLPDLLRNLKTYQVFVRMVDVVAARSAAREPDEVRERAAEQLAEDIVADYAGSLNLLDRLSREYHFKYVCLWQPSAFSETRLLPGEETDPLTRDPSLGMLFRAVNNLVKQREHSMPNFHDVSTTLNQRTVPTYIDYCHISEEGNDAMARRLCELLEPLLAVDKARFRE